MKLNIFIFLVLIGLVLYTNDSFSQAKVFQAGEELEYSVKFMGIRLGTIKINCKNETTFENKPVYQAYCEMKSSPSIPFVELNAIFESWMDKSLAFSNYFQGSNKVSKDSWEYQKIKMDYPNKKILLETGDKTRVFDKWSLDFDKKMNDGCSLFFFARQYVDIGKTVKLPTMIANQISYTFLNFHNKRAKAEVDAIKYPVKTIYFDGRAEWEGVYGLKGNFKGWFSDDEARVPIKAEMNVYVGSVDIELVKWKREGWVPPKY